MVCLTFLDVLLRYLFNSPIKGVYDVTQVALIVVVYLGIAYTHNQKGHVSIDVITDRLSPKGRLVIDTITTILAIGIFSILIWRGSEQFLYTLETGTIHSQYIKIPSAPFAAIIPFGCLLLTLLLLRDLLKNIAEGLRLHLRGYHWILMFGTPVLVAVLAALWVQPTLWQLSGATVGILGVAFSLLLMFTGMPVAFVLILTSFLFLAHIQGTNAIFSMFGQEIYRIPSSYVWSTLAFFTLMGFFTFYSRLGEDLYYAAYRWVGHLPGGLAQATIAASTAFAAITGTGLAPAVTMGTTALPEMRKYKYDDRLSTGSIVSGATLGPIIPPSTNFIIYAVLTQQSIGRLFVAGIIPGLILAIFFMVYIQIRCQLNPNMGPRGERSSWRERMGSSKAGGPVLFLFLLVIGGIYAGIFTPSEGAGVGCAGALIIGMAMRRFTWRNFTSALLESGKVNAMIFLILIGGVLFSRFAAFCNLEGVVMQVLTGLPVPPSVIIIIILLVFFILGFVIDILPLMLIGVPVVHPIAVAMGFDPTWFTVLVVIVIGVGTITPPVGINLFTLKGVAKDVPMSAIFRGAIPFSLVTLAVIALIFAVPSLVTWLPGLLY